MRRMFKTQEKKNKTKLTTMATDNNAQYLYLLPLFFFFGVYLIFVA